jgi:hypothetical protein
MNLNRKKWSHGLGLRDFGEVSKTSADVLKVCGELTVVYRSRGCVSPTRVVVLALLRAWCRCWRATRSESTRRRRRPRRRSSCPASARCARVIVWRSRAFVTSWRTGGVQIEPKKHLEANVSQLMALSIVQCLGMMIDTVVF